MAKRRLISAMWLNRIVDRITPFKKVQKKCNFDTHLHAIASRSGKSPPVLGNAEPLGRVRENPVTIAVTGFLHLAQKGGFEPL